MSTHTHPMNQWIMRYAIAGLILVGSLMLVYLVFIPLQTVPQPILDLPGSAPILPSSVNADAVRYAAIAKAYSLTWTADVSPDLNADAARYTSLANYSAAAANLQRGEKADAARYTALARPDTAADSARYTALVELWTAQAGAELAVETQAIVNLTPGVMEFQRGLFADADRYMGLVGLYSADVQRGEEADAARYTAMAESYEAEK